ncbi:OmpH family outer membrane protein [Flavobacteriaceae bacterium]|nr:OmpH family outer membrane protein [Flavobacteriaceae bacterium]
MRISKTIAYLLFVFWLGLSSVHAQRQARVAYIDMDYILSKLPSYLEAQRSLEERVGGWQMEIAARKLAIETLERELASEKALLTPILIEERTLEIQSAKASLVAYQQQRFGVQGDLFALRTSIVQPIQDLVFNEVQRLGKEKGYDLILDKSDGSTTILFANERFNLSNLIIRALSRQEMSANMGLSDAEINQGPAEEVPVNEALEAKATEDLEKVKLKEQQIAEKKAAQQKLREDRIKAYELRKQKLKEAREKKKSDKLPVQQKDSITE